MIVFLSLEFLLCLFRPVAGAGGGGPALPQARPFLDPY
jgi:hypothetical protein